MKICDDCGKEAVFISSAERYCHDCADNHGWFEFERTYEPINKCGVVKYAKSN